MKGLLPAPLGPSNPIAPGTTVRFTPSNARCGPKTFVRACVSITGAVGIFRRMLGTTHSADKQILGEIAFQESDRRRDESSRGLRIPLNSTRASYSRWAA